MASFGGRGAGVRGGGGGLRVGGSECRIQPTGNS